MRDSSVREALPAILKQVEIFATLGVEEREAIASRMEVRRHRAGHRVFNEGDPSDGLYVVQSGEVGVVTGAAGHGRILARLGRGQCFGEMSILTGEARSTGVLATLDCELLFLADSAFEDLLKRYPAVALSLGRTLSLRLRKANRVAREEVRNRILFCYSVSEKVDPWAFASSLARSLAACRESEILLVSLGGAAGAPPAQMSVNELAVAVRDGQAPGVASYAAELEPGVRALSLEITEGQWNERLLGRLLGLAVEQCGGIVVAGNFSGPADGATGGGSQPFLRQAIRQSDVSMLLVDTTTSSLDRARALDVHSSGPEPSEGGRWKVTLVRPSSVSPGTIQRVEDLLGMPVDFQVIEGERGGFDFLARRMSRAALGIALGGGGARGFAHIGILDVLSAEGIPIDVLGGTSMGAIISSLSAAGMEVTELTRTVRREWVQRNPLNDYTFPRSALIRGRRAEKVLRRVLGEVQIEDLPRPWFAVSADLVTAEEVVLCRGPMWQAVRASGSIPVLLLPVKVDGRFLVDGAIINNVPGDLLGRFGADISVAVDVTIRKEMYFQNLLDRDRGYGLFKKLLRKAGLFSEWMEYPSIIRTLRRIIDIEGMEILKTKSATFDMCIRPQVEGFDQLDFSKLDQLIDVGRAAATEALPALRARMREAARVGTA
jgi:predicted acylesterase/phospholipase RssA/CRP-like cAMP-binding protein